MLGPEQSSLQAAKYYDMHFYIDFLQEDPAGFLDASDALGLAFLSCTAAPNSELERPAGGWQTAEWAQAPLMSSSRLCPMLSS